MGISKRFFAEFSSSFSGSDAALSGSAMTQTFVSAGVSSSFYKGIQQCRLNLTGTQTRFCLTPSGSGRAQVVSVIHHPNDESSGNYYSMSYGIFHDGNSLFNHPNGYYTGVYQGSGRFLSASLNADLSKRVIAAGAVPYLSSTNHTGVMAVTIFYRTEVLQ
jgi:hypothetical protein